MTPLQETAEKLIVAFQLDDSYRERKSFKLSGVLEGIDVTYTLWERWTLGGFRCSIWIGQDMMHGINWTHCVETFCRHHQHALFVNAIVRAQKEAIQWIKETRQRHDPTYRTSPSS